MLRVKMSLLGTTAFSYHFCIVEEKSDFGRRDSNPGSERS